MVTGANITCIVDNLEKANLAERTHSKDDRRTIFVSLTTKGNSLTKKLIPQSADAVSDIISKLNLKEQKQLLSLLDKLVQ